jgi:putative endonuclease
MSYYVYILSNKAGTVLYTGVTNNLARRVTEHREKSVPGFTSRYNVYRLVYFEESEDVLAAIEREKAIKGGPRWRKLELILSLNPDWLDLYDEL